MQLRWAGITVGILTFMACIAMSVEDQQGIVVAQGLPGDVAAGEMIYQQRCKRCHGVSGWGDGPQAKELKVPPRNFNDPRLTIKTDEQLLSSIEFGIVQSAMHGFQNSLSKQAMRDVLAYVRLLGGRAQ